MAKCLIVVLSILKMAEWCRRLRGKCEILMFGRRFVFLFLSTPLSPSPQCRSQKQFESLIRAKLQEVGIFYHQFANRQTYARDPVMPHSHKVRIHCFSLEEIFFFLSFPLFLFYFLYVQLIMEIRLLPGLGGNGVRYPIEVLNDTGSDTLTIFVDDLIRLGYPHIMYHGWLGIVGVVSADGNVEHLSSLLVEIRFLRPVTYEPWGPWIIEPAVVRQNGPFLRRLSGRYMRDSMYFGTGAGNHHVAVADTKGGMSALI